MKKLLGLLVLVILWIASCSPKLSYFYKETLNPQYYVDSLSNYQVPNYTTWNNATVVGVSGKDSTEITTYVYRYIVEKQTFDITVIEFVHLPEKGFIVKQQERRE